MAWTLENVIQKYVVIIGHFVSFFGRTIPLKESIVLTILHTQHTLCSLLLLSTNFMLHNIVPRHWALRTARVHKNSSTLFNSILLPHYAKTEKVFFANLRDHLRSSHYLPEEPSSIWVK